MIKPFTPSDAEVARKDSMPDFVIEAVNRLLGRYYGPGKIRIKQDEIINEMIA